MAECATTPTATQFATITTSATTSTFSQITTTLPDSVSTVISEACLLESIVNGTTLCASTGSTTQVQTIRGGATTAQVPVILTVPVIQTVPTATLFTTSCGSSTSSSTTTTEKSSTTSSTTSSTSSSTTSSSSRTTSTPLTTSSILTTITPPPTTFTSASESTLANGQIVTQVITITSTGEPLVSSVPTTVPDLQAGQNNDPGPSNSKVGLIIGSVVGGFVGFILLVLIGWLVWKRWHRDPWKDMFESPDAYAAAFSPEGGSNQSRSPSPPPTAVRRANKKTVGSLDLDATPKPYHYGLVGHPAATPVSERSEFEALEDKAPGSRGRSPAMGMAPGAALVSAHGHSSSVGHGVPSPPLTPGGTVQPHFPPGALTATSNSSHRSNPSLTLSNWNPNADGTLVDASAPNGMSAKARLANYAPSIGPQDVVQHRDGGRVPQPSVPAPAANTTDSQPPAYGS